MKRFLLITVSILFTFLFSACGSEIKEEPDTTNASKQSATNTSKESTTTTTEKQSDMTATSEKSTEKSKSVLEKYFSKNFKDCTMHIKDFDNDSTEEMIVFERKLNSKKFTKECALYYIKVEKEKAYEADKLVIDDAFLDEELIHEYSQEYIEAIVNKNGYISCNFLSCYEAWKANYFLISVKENKLCVEKRLLDPGYSSALGLYYYEDYPDYWDTKKLYERDEMNEAKGKYSKYKEAIEKEIGTYGFLWKKFKNDGSFEKYIVADTSETTVLYRSTDDK